MDDTLAFLNLILPDSGWRCAFVQQQKQNYFFQTNEELATFLLQWDTAGYTTYHACASYRDPAGYDDNGKHKYRGQGNVQCCASFWCDTDAGAGKPYADANAAAAAAVAASAALGLPSPLYVCSGRGVHSYWPLAVEIEPTQWRRYALGLRNGLRRVGLQLDPARSIDSASILRTPGTHNRKEGAALPVVMGPLVEPYELEQFDTVLREQTNADNFQADARTSRTITSHIDEPAWMAGRRAPDHIYGKSAIEFVRADAYSERVADQCAQLGSFRADRGNLSEPLWYAGLGVIGWCVDGDQYAHEWGTGHPGYSREETDERLARCRSLSGATTCEKFASLNPAPCQACPHYGKIKSPIVLGSREAKSSVATGEGQAPGASGVLQTEAQAAPGQARDLNTLPALPNHFVWRGLSLVFQTEQNNQPVDQLISTYPIFLEGVMQGQTVKDFSLRFRQWLPAKGWFDFTVPAKTVMLGNQGLAELARYGANIHEGNLFLKYVKSAIDQIYEQGRLGVLYDQYGWKANNSAFLFGSKLYTSDGEFQISGSKELEVRNQWIGPGVTIKGDASAYGFERWRQAASSLFAAGCEAQSVALLASFAAPLMRFTASDEGGCIISLVTRASGRGKTTALAGASSVWGAREGLSLTNDDNKVTKWLTLGALGNLPIVFDEIQTKDPNVIRDFVINFTNGRDKMRASREGEIRHSAATWQTLLVSASNSSLVDSLSGTSKADYPAYRILELPLEVPENLRHELGDKLKNELLANTGFAGERFVQYIVRKDVRELIVNNLDRFILELWKTTKLPTEGRFWIRAVAAMAVAAQIVQQIGLVEFSAQRIVDWLVKRISVDKKGNGPVGHVTGGDWVAESIADFILTENINFLVVPALWKRGAPRIRPAREPRGKLSGTYAVQERQLTVSINALRSYAIENEIPFRELIETLQRRGCCGHIERRTLTAGTDVPGAVMNVLDLYMGHEMLAGADQKLSLQPDDDTTNVTPLTRRN